jgi:glycerol-3-phosphate dehydrogenase (NAD(P)+)
MSSPARIAVLGGGSWGTTLASTVAGSVPTVIWARRAEVAEEINARHTNSKYLGHLPLERSLQATASLDEALDGVDVLVMGVPSHGFRATLEEVAGRLRPEVPVVSLVKGLERGTRLRMTQIVNEVLPDNPAGVLAGPNLAREVLQGYAAAAVVAMDDQSIAESLQHAFAGRVFRVYTSVDVIGVEIAGALKNVVAIAAGMSAGLGTGDNTRSMVIARSLAELTRLGTAMGGDARTFGGLAGVGDLIATCISPLSRNRQVGEQLARGRKLDEIIEDMGQVAEGVKAARVVMELADEYGVDMPIAREVDAVINQGRTPEEAFRGLRRIKPTSEIHGVA